ncbi:uncharacterized protein LOC110455363 [Mizuhopecten yessoensis]|uniref:uncharacterized protein LOC110455363 n=1 Tax=Mizuhopecten yessoensis TaxID=6573 RepID=UPI000B4590E6|nr:uncharacterized protein LOC110455363 [Mizuhopecten yessoensis]
MAGRTHRSIVSTKYGDRPLIDVPPISFPQRVSYQQTIQNPRYQMGNLADDLNLPPNAHQTVTPMYPQQNHAQPSYGFRPNLNPYGNVIQNSNVIPYQSAPVPSYPYQNGGPSAYQQPYQNEGYPSTNQGLQGPSGETHHFYGPHGERIPAPILNNNFGFHNQMRYPTNFKMKGKLKRGQMTSIEVVESNISYRDLPDVVIKDLKRLYGHIDKADVTIIAESGEYHIYATPKQNGVPQVNPGYNYERRSRGGSNTADHFTKKYHQTDDVMYKFDPTAKTYYVDPRSYSVASEGRRPREYKVTEEPRLPVPKPVRRDF